MVYCSVVGCPRKRTKGVSAYGFPSEEEPERRLQWIRFCMQDDGWVPGSTSKICADHFRPEDSIGVLNNLKFGTVPSINCNYEEVKQEPMEEEYLSETENLNEFAEISVEEKVVTNDPLVFKNQNLKISHETEDWTTKTNERLSHCRLCLEEDSPAIISLFAKFDGEYVAHMLNYCTSLEVKREDSLPQAICNSCFNKLKIAHELKQTSIQSDHLLRNAILKVEQIDSNDFNEMTEFLELKMEAAIKPPKVKKTYTEKESAPATKKNIFIIHEKPDKLKKDVVIRRPPIKKKHSGSSKETKLQELKCLDCNATYTAEKYHKCYATKQCSICNTMWESAKHLSLHFKESHITDRECRICKLVCGSASDLHFHLRTHQEGLSFICDVCGKVFSRADYLRLHRTSHFEHFQCDLCNVIIKRKTGLHRHMLYIHLKTNQELVCTECGLSFKQIHNLQYHNISVHGAPSAIQCKICGKKFVYPSQLKNHDRTIHQKLLPNHQLKEGAYKCQFCIKSFKVHSRLLTHEQLHKQGIPMTSTNNFLMFNCEFCGKAFKHRHLLTDHRTTHTKERNFQCKLCEKRFRRVGNLRNHLKIIHKEIKPFVSSNPNYDDSAAAQ